MPARQLWPVVATNRLRHSALADDCFQHSRHSPASEAGVHFQRQTLSCVGVHHAEHPDRPPAFHCVMHKVQCPLLIRRSPRQQRLPLPHAMLALLPPDRQSRLPIHPMQPLVVHVLSASLQQHLQSPIPEARLLPRQLHQLRPQRLIRSQRAVTIRRHRHCHQSAGSPLAEGILLLHLLDSCLQRYELQPFFRITDCSASLSRLRSATSFRSFVFSSRSCLASCAWLTSIPPYFAFQASIVCFDTPASRATSSALRPASSCFSTPMICASVCLLFDISASPSALCRMRGAGHSKPQNRIEYFCNRKRAGKLIQRTGGWWTLKKSGTCTLMFLFQLIANRLMK